MLNVSGDHTEDFVQHMENISSLMNLDYPRGTACGIVQQDLEIRIYYEGIYQKRADAFETDVGDRFSDSNGWIKQEIVDEGRTI
jgi:hypothetical protein